MASADQEDLALRQSIAELWRRRIVPGLSELIAIPNQSPLFDPDWENNGLLDRAAEQIAGWARELAGPGAVVEVLQAPGRSPLVWIELAGDPRRTVLFYGHLDKQPPSEGWSQGLGPHTPVVRGGKLYGRGAVDDGYAAYTAIAALSAARAADPEAPRAVILIEASEESQSIHLPPWLDELAPRLGTPELVVVLDSACGDYERLWLTTSLRGSVVGTLSVSLLEEGAHSGHAAGIVASSFRVIRGLLDRIEDADSGAILLPELVVEIPPERRREAAAVAAVLGDEVVAQFPWRRGGRPVTDDLTELLLNQTWRPALTVTGQRGIPSIEAGGNVLRKETALKLALRLPPGVDGGEAGRRLTEVLESAPPYGARVRFEVAATSTGWRSPPLAPPLAAALASASREFFGKPECRAGVGGGITVVALLAARFPEAQMLVTGVLGPDSNPHAPDESLDLAAAEKLTCCLARVLAGTATRPG